MTMPVNSDSTNEFAARARQFVNWCDAKHTEESDTRFRFDAQRVIALLYAAGCDLLEVQFQDSPDLPNLTKAQLDEVAANLARLPFRHYWSISMPSEMEEEKPEPGCGDLLDDFLDIYRDLRHGLLLFDTGHTQGAAYHWHQMFFHWGQHAVDALSALHSYDSESNNTV